MEVRLETADAVFVGEIVSQQEQFIPELPDDYFLDPDPDLIPRRPVNFAVSVSWKGVTGREVGVLTAPTVAGCGLGGSVGDTFLVFAYVDPEDGRHETGQCSSWSSAAGEYESQIADLEALDIEPLELVEGPDPQFPPVDLTEVGQATDGAGSPAGGKGKAAAGPCGFGVGWIVLLGAWWPMAWRHGAANLRSS